MEIAFETFLKLPDRIALQDIFRKDYGAEETGIVKDKSTLRKLIKVCNDAENSCYTNADDLEGILNTG